MNTYKPQMGTPSSPAFAATLTCIGIAVGCLTSGCATNDPGGTFKDLYASDDPCSHNARNIGLTLGVLGGAIVGHALGGEGNKAGGTVVGAGVGALIGGVIGYDIDRRRCELSKIAKANNLDMDIRDIKVSEITETTDASAPAAKKADSVVGMSVSIVDKGEQFATDSEVPNQRAVHTFAEIAKTYLGDDGRQTSPQEKQQATSRAKKMRVLLVGHTDDTGSSRHNADLSEARAKAVAKIFAENGFSADQVFYQGAGETLPIADNRTEIGRAKNRRVEIVDLGDEQAFSAFLASRKPNVVFYRPADVASSAAAKTDNSKSVEPRQHAAKPESKAALALTPTKPDRVAKSESPSHTTAPVVHAVAMNLIDFGGHPMSTQYRAPDIGKADPESSFGLISSAHAADDLSVGGCGQDRPRVKHGVKSLKNDQVQKFATSDYLPGVYGTSWSDTVNGHLVALTNVSVLRDGGQPANRPEVLVYKNYVAGSNPKPDLSTLADVNAYKGSKALLYRVFLGNGQIRCIDMVIPNKAPNSAPDSTLVYMRDNVTFQADFSPNIAR